MRDKVKDTIQKHQLLSVGDKVLIAVSGGADSLSLLHVLHKLQRELSLSLHIAHIHHGLRRESDQEVVLMKKHALKLGVPISVSRVHVEQYKTKAGGSTQEVARNLRYAALLKIAQRVGATQIATAHHRDDRVETLLMRILYGSGLDGLAAIPVCRELRPGVTLIRPLHDVSREEIENYCRIHQLVPVHDASNQKLTYLRNRIRLRLIPFLENEFGYHVKNSIAKTIDLLAQDARLLADVTADVFHQIAHQTEDNLLSVDLYRLHSLTPALQARILRQAMWTAGCVRASSVHVKNVLTLTENPVPSARLSLPGGVQAIRQYEVLHIGKPKKAKIEDSGVLELLVPGRTYIPWSGSWLYAEYLKPDEVTLPIKDRKQAYLDADLLVMPLYVSSRRPGDRLWPLGASGSRKVKKVLADRKVPRDQRHQIPLVISNNDVVWLGGVEIAHPYRVSENTKKILWLKLYTESEKEGDTHE